MSRFRTRRPSAALLISILALLAALDGPALASDAVGFASRVISGKNIKKRSISGIRLRNNTLTGTQIDEAKLGPVPAATNATNAVNAVTAVNAATATSAGRAMTADLAAQLSGRTTFVKRQAATDGLDADAARQSAPMLTLATAGPISVYGKCFRDATADRVHAELFVRSTTENGILSSGIDTLAGNTPSDVLGPATPELDRELVSVVADAGKAAYAGVSGGAWTAVAGGGFAVAGHGAAGAKNGTPAAGDTQYGPGDGCLFTGELEAL